jgi:YD repeat-containing protein
LADGVREIADPVRGRRRYRLDDGGRIAEAWLADGRHVALERDGEGALVALAASDGFRLRFEPAVNGTGRVWAGDRVTRVHAGWDTLSLDAGQGAVTLERDGDGRCRRVMLPGSTRALRYDWDDQGGCVIGAEGGGAALRIVAGPHGTETRWDGGTWVERLGPARLAWRVLDRRERTVLALSADLDLQLRTRRRRWSDGAAEAFARDAAGRLARWTRGAQEVCYQHGPHGLLAERGTGLSRAYDVDAGGRVLAVSDTSGAHWAFAYDDNGRRVAAAGPDGERRFVHDVLGQLTRIVGPDGSTVTHGYDGLGRRVETCWTPPGGPARLRHEHRDLDGRLWAVTDGAGRAMHTFIWLGGRVVARIDGPIGDPLAELFLCDHLGTLLAVILAPGLDAPAVERVEADPYGGITDPARPTLHGHFGDPRTGLVHFGARDWDVGSRSFLTPDPYHGGADDPRRWAGVSAGALAGEAEVPRAGVHAYALCQFDPVGRLDPDGHRSTGAAIFWTLFNFTASFTWGWPLTAVSLFFFLPLDVYFELLGRIIQVFRFIFENDDIRRAPQHSTFPWPNHSIFGLRGMFVTGRQNHAAFALNGFLPRVIAGGGISGDRAVTIGHVVWIRRHELNILGRPEVLTVRDIDGAGGVTAFNADPTKDSVLAVLGTGGGKRWLHVSYWARGFGNSVVTVGAQDAFADLADGGVKPGFVHLARPLPLDMPAARERGSANRMDVQEYLHTPGTSKQATVQLDTRVAFALRTRTRGGINPGDRLELQLPSAAGQDPVYVLVAEITTDFESASTRSTVLLYQGFPARVLGGAGRLTGLTARRILPDARAGLDGWTAPGGPTILERVAAGAAIWPPELEQDERVLVTATVKGPAFTPLGSTPPPDNDVVGARVKKLTSTVSLDAALDPGLGNTEVLVLRLTGQTFTGKVPDAAKPLEMKFEGREPSFPDDSLVEIRLTRTGARTRARVVRYTARVLTVASLSAPLAPVADDQVTVQRLAPGDKAEDRATAANPTGLTPAIEVKRTRPYVRDVLLLFRDAPQQQIRVVTGTDRVQVELSDAVVGAGPFTVRPARVDPGFGAMKNVEQSPLLRFLRHTGGDLPSTFKSYPDAVLSVFSSLLRPSERSLFSEFYLRGAPADLEPRGARWQPASIGGSEYFVLQQDLPLFEETSAPRWFVDREEPRFYEIAAGPPPAYEFEIRELDRTAATRADAGGSRVLALEPEVLVPEEPRVRFTHRDSLIEHELYHAVQNNRYGPFLGAFPLTGLLATGVELADLQDVGVIDWFRQSFPDPGNDAGIRRYEVISIGGLMTLAWKWIILGPFQANDAARAKIQDLDFNDLNQFLNPVISYFVRHYPKPAGTPSPIDPDDPFTQDGSQIFFEIVARILDLRSWVPFLGLVPTWLGDSARNFIEQQASRASGDLYSTILSAGDRFNLSRSVFSDFFDANLTRPLGEAIRVMIYAGGRSERLLRRDHATRPESPFLYQDIFVRSQPITIECSTAALVHARLGTPVVAAGAAMQIEGPDGTLQDFHSLAAHDQFVPAMRSLVPIPPQVNRSAGFYFVAASPGTYELTAPVDAVDAPARTHAVTLSITEGRVTLGAEDVPYAVPPAHPALPATRLKRFLTETTELVVQKQARRLFQMTSGGAHAGLVTITDTPRGARIDIAAVLPPAGASREARVRVYRVLRKNDRANAAANDPQFDLQYREPSLQGIRTYLDTDVWFPVRDFILEVEDLPALPAVTQKSDETHTLPVVLRLGGPERLRVTLDAGAPGPRPRPAPDAVPLPRKKRRGASATHPRGEEWDLGPLAGEIEDPAVYDVAVDYGPPAATVTRAFKLRIEPVIHLTAGGAFRATPAAPLELTVNGGTAPYRAAIEGAPAGVTPRVQVDKVHVELTAAGPPIDPPRTFVVVVTDDRGKKGRRSVELHRVPPP